MKQLTTFGIAVSILCIVMFGIPACGDGNNDDQDVVTGTDLTVTETTETDSIGDVAPALIDLSQCDSSLPLPYRSHFTQGETVEAAGWSSILSEEGRNDGWTISTSLDGPGPDNFARFGDITPATSMTAGLVSSCLDASTCENAEDGVTTVQWRMAYHHSDPENPVTLKVLATENDDYENATVLWSMETAADIEFDIYTAQIPADLQYSTGRLTT